MDKKKNVVAIVQARMRSSRLPGKVLMDIAGMPMLLHVINRLKCSKFINDIVIATSISPEDSAIEKFCKSQRIKVYRGNEIDVLDRYYKAAKFYNADPVVRITADCPMIDPQVLDRVISEYLRGMKDFDGASNVVERSYPRGLDAEVISFSSLERCWKEADNDYQREHVTIYIYENPGSFKLCSVVNDKNLSHLRWTVDEENDLKFAREIYQRLFKKDKIFLTSDILDLLEKEPHLKEINKSVTQKVIPA